MFRGKNVLVAGGAGFIGTNLVHRMADLGANVRATWRHKPPRIQNDRVEFVQCDLSVMEECQKVVRDMDYVYMCAANTAGAAVMASTPLVHVTPNVVMNALFMEAAYLAKVKKFIFISSSVVYPISGDRPVKEDEMLVGEPFDTYYGAAWMKRFGEKMCTMFTEKLKNPMTSVVVRPANIYGPYDKFDPNASHVMAATIRKVVERHDPIRVWGDGEDVRDFIYVDDFIDGLLLATEKMDVCDPINIASGEGYNIKQMLRMMLEIDGYADAKIVHEVGKPSMIPIRLFDTTKAETLLGFKTKTSLRDGIAKTIRWFRETQPTS